MLPELMSFLVLAAVQEAPAEAASQILRLKSGDIAFGAIVAHDPEGIRFRRLETGGEVELPWSVLDPTEADGLRQRYGYVEASSEELLIDADRIELANGSEVIGRIVNRTDEHIWIKRAEGSVPIPKTQVRGAITTVQVPALDLFTKDELYHLRSQELEGRLAQEGRAGAMAHDELARYAERLFDYAHALEHYQRSLELDPAFDPQRIGAALTRAKEKGALQQQVDHLAEIDLQRARKRYDKALELLGQFRALYPSSPLMEDLNKLQDRVTKSQERDLREAIVLRWHFWSVRLARDAARLATFEEVQAYLDEKMGEDVAQKVRADVQSIYPGLEVDQVRRAWSERKGGKFRTATYGLGTWLLGEGARAELDKDKEAKEKEKEAAKGTQAEARKKLQERLERYIENQKLARDAAENESKENDPQLFWAAWNMAGRAQWILAYYAEKSGDFRDQQGRLSNCRECGGTGARNVLFTGSAASVPNQKAGDVLVPCPTCHTIGVVRRIRYR